MLRVGLKILLIAFIFLLIVNMVAYVAFGTASEPITFTTLLQQIDKAPQIELSMDDSINIFKINKSSDFKTVQFLIDLINALGSVIGFVVWIVTLLINLVAIVGYFMYLIGVQGFSAYI